MWRAIFCLLLLAGFATASTIPLSDRDALAVNSNGCPNPFFCGYALISVAAAVGPLPRGSFASRSETFRGNFLFTVTSGPDEGLFAPCLSAGADWFQGFASAVAVFDGAGVAATGRGGGVESCIQYGHYTLGVPQYVNILLSVQASAGSNLFDNANADAFAAYYGLLFFDSAGQRLSDISFSLVELPVPDASAASLVLCGIFILVCRGQMKAGGIRQSNRNRFDRSVSLTGSTQHVEG